MTNDGLFYTVCKSPVGDLTLTADRGNLTGVFFDQTATDPTAKSKHVVTQLIGNRTHCETVFSEVISQLNEFFCGDRREFDLKSLPLSPQGTDFQKRVWSELTRIPFGETISYGQLANRIGQPTASRAVGMANGRNPISIIIPCHRVIGSNKKLVGYGGGLERKVKLLTLEAESLRQFRVESVDNGRLIESAATR